MERMLEKLVLDAAIRCLRNEPQCAVADVQATLRDCQVNTQDVAYTLILLSDRGLVELDGRAAWRCGNKPSTTRAPTGAKIIVCQTP